MDEDLKRRPIVDTIEHDDDDETPNPEKAPKGSIPIKPIHVFFVIGILAVSAIFMLVNVMSGMHHGKELGTAQQIAGQDEETQPSDPDAVNGRADKFGKSLPPSLQASGGLAKDALLRGAGVANGALAGNTPPPNQPIQYGDYAGITSLTQCPRDALGNYDLVCRQYILNKINANPTPDPTQQGVGAYNPPPNNAGGQMQGQQQQAQEIQEDSHAAPLDFTRDADYQQQRQPQQQQQAQETAPLTQPIQPVQPEQQPRQDSSLSALSDSENMVKPRDVTVYHCTSVCMGDYITTVLQNRVTSESSGPLVAEVVVPVVSHKPDHKIIIPVGAKVFGETTALVGQNQTRIYAKFTSIRYPGSGATFALDQYPATDQQGAAGLSDLVNHHYFKIFGTASLLGALGAVAQGVGSNNAYNGGSYNPLAGVSSSIGSMTAMQATQILQQQLTTTLPTVTLREGRNYLQIYVRNNLNIPEGL